MFHEPNNASALHHELKTLSRSVSDKSISKIFPYEAMTDSCCRFFCVGEY